MGRRSRRRGVEKVIAPESEYHDTTGNVLALRGAMSPSARRKYAEVFDGSPLSREDAWQQAVEFLFEQLAARWEIAGTDPIERPKELIGRYRMASASERQFVRDSLRAHLGEHFPEVQAP